MCILSIDFILGLLGLWGNATVREYFRILMRSEKNVLVAVHEAKYYKRNDGLAIGPGCFTRGLEYATGKKAVVIGKPNQYFFECVIPDNVAPVECCMIGDVSCAHFSTAQCSIFNAVLCYRI